MGVDFSRKLCYTTIVSGGTRFCERVILYEKINTNYMDKHRRGHNVIVWPGQDQLNLAIHVSPELTFQHTSPRRRIKIVATVLGLLLLALPHSSRAVGYSPTSIINATNLARQEFGVTPLTVDSRLTRAAEAQATDMLSQQYFDHVSPSGQSPWSWVQQAGYRYTTVGENLADNFSQADDVIHAWLQSATHRANLLNPKFRDIGVAMVGGTIRNQPTVIVVQFFGSQTITNIPVIGRSQPTTPGKRLAIQPVHVPGPVAAVVPALPAPGVVPVPINLPEVLGTSNHVIHPLSRPAALFIQPTSSPNLSALPLLLLAVLTAQIAVLVLAAILNTLYQGLRYPQPLQSLT